MKVRTDQFRQLSQEALENRFIRDAIARANVSFRAARVAAIDSMPDWEQLRQQGHDIKRRALDHLPWALEEFEKNLTARGGQVHFCEDGASARDTVLSIVRSHGATRVTKSKSMATEEIGLNPCLEEAGVRVVEGDLGEYIVQLAGEAPSHIISPAIHKSREEISRLLNEHIDCPLDADIPDMTRAARRALRDDFLGAEVGISGVNFAVAQSGTVVIVENEGNARMSTTIPKVHIAVVGIEKVVPRLEDLSVLLRILCRSATGQRISSYVSFISGPRTAVEAEGPEELHVVFLDAGRSRLWADPKTRASLHCIRCGACLNFCPVYERVGGHAYGWVYPGPIGSVITPHYVGIERSSDLPQASSLCGRCAEVCPVKIPLPDMLLDLRARNVDAGGVRATERWSMRLFSMLASMPVLWRTLTFVGRPLYRLLESSGLAARLPGAPGRWSRSRALPKVGTPSFRARWRATDGFRDRRGAGRGAGRGDRRGGES